MSSEGANHSKHRARVMMLTGPFHGIRMTSFAPARALQNLPLLG